MTCPAQFFTIWAGLRTWGALQGSRSDLPVSLAMLLPGLGSVEAGELYDVSFAYYSKRETSSNVNLESWHKAKPITTSLF